MSYYDGYLAPVNKANKEKYIEHLNTIWQVFKDHGALSMTELWGDEIPDGVLTSYPLALKLEDGEEVVMGYIEWASKEARRSAWDAIMEDERMQNAPPLFDGKRLIYGGFERVFRI